MTQDIPLKGITSATSDYDAPDGELEVAHNIMCNQSDIKTVRAPKELFQLPSGWTILAIHQTSRFKHYIIRHRYTVSEQGSDVEKQELRWMDAYAADLQDEADLVTGIGSEQCPDERKIGTPSTILCDNIKPIGNTLIMFADSGTNYYLWKDTYYLYLGDKIPYLPMRFGLYGSERDSFSSFTFPSDKRYIRYSGGNFERYWTSDEYEFWEIGEVHPEQNEIIDNAVYGTLNSLLKEVNDLNKFSLPFLVRYAYRLYDGSYVMQSAPVLLLSNTIPKVALTNVETDGGYVAKMNYAVRTGSYELLYTISDFPSERYIEKLREWGDIVTSVDIFVSPPIYAYDASKSIIRFIRSSNAEDYYGLKDLDSSVVSWSHGQLHYCDYRIQDKQFLVEIGAETRSRLIGLRPFSEAEIKRKIVEESRFYRVSSIPLSDLQYNTDDGVDNRLINVPMKEGVINTLTSQEILPDGLRTAEYNKYLNGFPYNNRIAYYGVTRNTRKMYAMAHIQYTDKPWYRHDNYHSEETDRTGGYTSIAIYVQRKGQSRWSESNDAIIQHYGAPIPVIFFADTTIQKVKIETYESVLGTFQSGTFDAIKSTMLNCSYCWIGWDNITQYLPNGHEILDIDPQFSITELNKIYLTEVDNPFLVKASNILTIAVSNIIGVSTATKALSQGQFGQFPMYAFTNEGVWALEIASNGSISARQAVTRDVVLGDGKSITQTDDAVVFASENGIILLKGADKALLSANIDATRIMHTADIPHIADIAPYPDIISATSFEDFITDCRMIYDYHMQRIIIYNPAKKYAFAYDITAQQWSTIDATIASNVLSYPNALAVMPDGEKNHVVDFSAFADEPKRQEEAITYNTEHLINLPVSWWEDTTKRAAFLSDFPDGKDEDHEYVDVDVVTEKAQVWQTKAFILTRPMKLQDADTLKTVTAVLVRGRFRNIMHQEASVKQVQAVPDSYPDAQQYGNIIIPGTLRTMPHIRTVLYGSNDLTAWHTIASSQNGHIRGMRGTPYKYFRVAIIADLDYAESISGITLEYTPRQTNRLR